MIVFLWTPPHFWALALLISDDYEKTGVPMMPVVRGEEHTRNRILVYSVLLVAFTLVPCATGFFGAVYLAAALMLGGAFLGGSPSTCSASPRAGPPCSSTSARWPTCSCCSARWRPTGSSPPD